MSNRDPDSRYRNPSQIFGFTWLQQAKALLHTCAPGIVREYDPTTKRARVQPAVKQMIDMPDEEGNPNIVNMEKPPILDVPVRQNATGAHLEHHQIDEGDVVLLCFTERGIEKFKVLWGELSDPPVEAFYSERDAMAIPWGVETIAPVRETGWLVQNETGSCYVSVDNTTIRLITDQSMATLVPGSITLENGGSTATLVTGSITLENGGSTLVVSNGMVTINSPEVTVTAPQVILDSADVAIDGAKLEHNDTNIGDDHVHILSIGPPITYTGPPRPTP